MFWWPLTVAMAFLSHLADAEVGHGAELWALGIVAWISLRLISVGRVSWFYAFMAAFYFLGCWLKVVVHHVFDYPYIEPTGNFSFSPEEWADYYGFAITTGSGLIVARLLTVLSGGQLPSPRQWKQVAGPVSPGSWWLLIVIAAGFYLVNNQLAFFVTGVDARITLPFALNAPLAFMALIGFAVITSSLLERDVTAAKALTTKSVIALLAICAIASISMASRAAIVMQAVPILVAATYTMIQLTGKRPPIRPFIYFSAFLATVLIIVSIYRIQVFSGSSLANTELVFFFALESAMLVIDRWVGAEALMVAVSEPTHSMALLTQLLTEDAARGNDAIFQVVAGSKYDFLQGMTFLTLPGYFGVLGLSGSAWILGTGVFVLTTAGICYEGFAKRVLCGSTVSAALISAALANALTQLSFPRLLVPFTLQMTVLVLLLALHRRRTHRPTSPQENAVTPVAMRERWAMPNTSD